MSNPYSTPTADMASFANGAETYEPKLFATTGRIGRIRYLAYSAIVTLLAYLVMGVVGFGLGMSAGPEAGFGGFAVAMLIIFIPMVYMTVVIAKRRLHDLDKSGWWMLLLLIPLVGFIMGLYMVFAPGSKNANQFGPPPAANTTLLVVAGLILPIIMFIGIVAAIALPAYQDYVRRAQEAQATESVEVVDESGE